MSLETIRDKVLAASGKTEDLLALICDLYIKEINSEKNVLAGVLSELHNSGVIDIVKIVREVDRNSYGRKFFTILHVFENVLPSLDTRVEDVLNCLAHLKQETGGDSSINGINEAFERFCSFEVYRPRDSVLFILKQSNLNEYATFLSSSILAYGSDHVVEVIQTTERLIAHRNEVVRNQAYIVLGRLGISEVQTSAVWTLIKSSAASEHDNDCRAEILRAALRFGEKFPTYWPQIEKFLITFVDSGSAETLYVISRIVAFRWVELPKNVLDLLIKQLKKTPPEHKGIIDNIDHLLVRLVGEGESSFAIELLESILSAGVEFKTLDYFSNELKTKHQELCNHIITKWFLYGKPQLCHSILDLLHGFTDKKIEIKADLTLLDNEVKQVFVNRKAIGWLFSLPIAAASFIMSISENASTAVIENCEDILFYPLLLSYPGELECFFQSCINKGIQKDLCERLLAKLKLYHDDIEKVLGLNELKAPNENLSIYWKDFDKKMQVAHEESSKTSFIRMIAKTQRLLYGNSSIYYMHQSDGKSVRQEMQMQSFSHSTEMPRLNSLDSVSLDYFLITCRCERIKNEINS